MKLPAWWPWAVYAAVNLGLILGDVTLGPHNIDWKIWTAVAESPTDPYVIVENGRFVWSPVAAWFMPAIVFLGYWAWLGLHVAVVFLLRDWRLIGLVLVSWPFWNEAKMGNTFIFAFVAGVLALRGSRTAGWAYLFLSIIIPRPVQLPLLVWLVWKRPELRLPFVGMAAAQLALVVGLGYLEPWIEAMRLANPGLNIGPAAIFGPWWFAVGIPLGAWLTWKGYVGWAGLAISPYILPVYWLMALVPKEVVDVSLGHTRDSEVCGGEPERGVGVKPRPRFAVPGHLKVIRRP